MTSKTANMNEIIRQKLAEFETNYHVKILHAVESGSRAWGFASEDSDYDIRVIYVHDKNFYLKLQDTQDFINLELNALLDINGWDLDKSLRLIHRSNTTIFEWANSPIIYKTTAEWQHIIEHTQKYFSPKVAMYQYYGTARQNFEKHLQAPQVNYKKYFYVIRPLLACMWIEQKKTPPPVLFETLKGAVLDATMQEQINTLQAQKMQMKESEKGEQVPTIQNFIKHQLSYYDSFIKTLPNESAQEWDTLEQLFLKTIQ